MYQAHIAAVDGILEDVPTGDVPARELYRRLDRCGLTPVQAGNLTARVKGLPPAATGWQVTEIEQLLFLRWRSEHGLVPS